MATHARLNTEFTECYKCHNLISRLIFTSEAEDAGRKNVLFLMADDLRVQLGSYEGSYFASPEHPKMHTPNLDRLASKSMLLKRAYVQQAVCSPSRTSLMTGRRPDTTRVWDLDTYWRSVSGNFTTIPQYFKSHGYTSIGIGKIFHPGAASGFDDPLSWSTQYWRPTRTAWEVNKTSWIAVPDEELTDNPLVDEQVANHAVDMLRSLVENATSGNTQNPWFMAVGFYKPHLPFVFPASVLEHYPENEINLPDNPYAPANMPPIAWTKYNELRLNYNDIRALNATGEINTTLPDKNVLELRRAYYSAVTWMDSQVGRVLDELERLNLSDNTIISFLGDHGWQLGEHAEWCKHTNFDIATHAPMMIRIPGMTDSGMTTEKLTEFVDLFPTLVEAADLPKLDVCPMNSSEVQLCSEGSSLMALIRNPNAPWKNASFSQFTRRTRGSTAMGYTMTTTEYRYTEWIRVTYEPTFEQDWSTVYEVELYDHTNDPEENRNVVDDSDYVGIKNQLSQWLRAGWRAVLQ